MDTKLFNRFAPVISSLSAAELEGSPSLNSKMRLAQDGNIDVCYVPFDYLNPQARIVIVGITPGRTQMLNAIKEARRQLDKGADAETTLMAAKQTGAFSDPRRRYKRRRFSLGVIITASLPSQTGEPALRMNRPNHDSHFGPPCLADSAASPHNQACYHFVRGAGKIDG